MGTTIEQYQPGIGCHNNFVKAKDAFSRVQMCFTLYLPTLKDVVGHYKLWNEVTFWLDTNYVLNVYIRLLIRPDMSRNAG